jgi:hypothetical protein
VGGPAGQIATGKKSGNDQGREVDYEIYFQLRRHGGDTLRMVIESAYVRAPGTPGPGVPHERKGRVRFHVMAAKVNRLTRDDGLFRVVECLVNDPFLGH